jgi:rhodanese-related sulfurtransferase
VKLFNRLETIDAAQAAERLARGEVVAVDVRQDAEWKAGHIKGAVHLPLARIGSGPAGLREGTPVVTVCRSGHRSAAAGRALRAAGHQVLNLDGGMKAWAREGLPLEPRNGKVL